VEHVLSDANLVGVILSKLVPHDGGGKDGRELARSLCLTSKSVRSACWPPCSEYACTDSSRQSCSR
jgi:hypothetical protein